MGNLCGKAEKEDPFSKPGRTLGSSPAPAKGTAAIPSASSRRQATSGSKTSRDQALGGAVDAEPPDRGGDVGGSARKAAALAAEERARSSQQQAKGKLSSQLQHQKAQTRTNTLEQASADERRARDADQIAETRNWQ